MAPQNGEAMDTVPNKAEPPFLLTSEVARVLGVTPETVRHWERVGRLPAQKTSTGVRLFDRRDVERFARAREARTQEASS